MKYPRMTLALLGALVIGTAAGCADTGPRQAAGANVNDAAISAGVKAAIAGEPGLQGSDIQVETSKGIVQLSGFVSSAESVAAAAEAARTVKGVRSIRNDLRLK